MSPKRINKSDVHRNWIHTNKVDVHLKQDIIRYKPFNLPSAHQETMQQLWHGCEHRRFQAAEVQVLVQHQGKRPK